MQYRTKETASGTWGSWTDITQTDGDWQKFRTPEGTSTISSSNPGIGEELTYTFYGYKIGDNITTAGGYTSEMATEIANMITKGTTEENIMQWLASRCVICENTCVGFRVRRVNGVWTGSNTLFSSAGEFFAHEYSVRPVVVLNSSIKLTGTGESIGSATNKWQMSEI